MQLSKNQKVQEDQYSFPYHYADLLAEIYRGIYYVHYLDLLRKVKKLAGTDQKKTIIDAGCGDGRLCFELSKGKSKIIGLDYSKKALAFARAFSPSVEFREHDLTKKIDLKGDTVILMETLEHIRLNDVEKVIENVAGMLETGGRLIITVPSKNLKLADKHYQHFDEESLKRHLSRWFNVEKIEGYHRKGFPKFMFENYTRLTL
ncbi:MAG: class I SAM-dependent methyltransferase, partial [Nanoarchaeota archaeon]|nr:class I SAM-dependent methyltransferase [Nanoarchaeota archaeon]